MKKTYKHVLYNLFILKIDPIIDAISMLSFFGKQETSNLNISFKYIHFNKIPLTLWKNNRFATNIKNFRQNHLILSSSLLSSFYEQKWKDSSHFFLLDVLLNKLMLYSSFFSKLAFGLICIMSNPCNLLVLCLT